MLFSTLVVETGLKLHLNVITKYQATPHFNNKLNILVSKPNYYHSKTHKTSILFLTNKLGVFLNYFQTELLQKNLKNCPVEMRSLVNKNIPITSPFNDKLIIFVSKPKYYHSRTHKTSISFLTNMLGVFLNYFTN